jgi:acyl-coenzyme A thioesterase PaaI-like protein
MVSAEALQALLSEAGFNRSHRLRVESVADGECTLLVEFSPDLERPGGVVAGASFMAAADAAMWLAILTRLGPGDGSVTSELTTAFLAAARQEDFRCTARVLKWGRRLIYGVAECVGASGRLLTHHTVTYARADGARSAGTD